MGVTIVAINRITKAGYTVLFDHECCRIRDKNNRHVGNIPVSITGLYKVERVYAAATKVEHIDLTTLVIASYWWFDVRAVGGWKRKSLGD